MKIKIPMSEETFVGILLGVLIFGLMGLVIYAGIAMIFVGVWYLSIIMFIGAWVMLSVPIILFNKERYFNYIYPFEFGEKNVTK